MMHVYIWSDFQPSQQASSYPVQMKTQISLSLDQFNFTGYSSTEKLASLSVIPSDTRKKGLHFSPLLCSFTCLR